MSDITFTEKAAAPATPATGKWTLYTKSGGVYVVDDAGTEYGPFGAGGAWDGDIADINLDGGTDIGAALADADLILVDDGAGGTNRKSALSRVWTYISGKLSGANAVPIAGIDLDGGTDIGAALVDADLILVDDGAGGTNRKSALSRVKTYAQGIKLDDLTAPDDNTDLDASTSKHGLLPKLGGGTTNYLRADGTWAEPAGGGGGIDPVMSALIFGG